MEQCLFEVLTCVNNMGNTNVLDEDKEFTHKEHLWRSNIYGFLKCMSVNFWTWPIEWGDAY